MGRESELAITRQQIQFHSLCHEGGYVSWKHRQLSLNTFIKILPKLLWYQDYTAVFRRERHVLLLLKKHESTTLTALKLLVLLKSLTPENGVRYSSTMLSVHTLERKIRKYSWKCSHQNIGLFTVGGSEIMICWNQLITHNWQKYYPHLLDKKTPQEQYKLHSRT